MLITDSCRACGAMLERVKDRVACRACFEQKAETPTMCRRCLAIHYGEKHPGREMEEHYEIKKGDRVFRRRSDLFATVVEVNGGALTVRPEWPHDGSRVVWPLAEVRLAGALE